MITFTSDTGVVMGFPEPDFMKDGYCIDLHGHTIKGEWIGQNYCTFIPISPLKFREDFHTKEYPDKAGASIVSENKVVITDDAGREYIIEFDEERWALRNTLDLLKREKLLK